MRVPSRTIVARLEAAGKLAEAAAILDSNISLKYRFLTADGLGGVLVDDPDLNAALASLGLDAKTVLAPDG